jgi:geranyl-CoA carboxylase alpha subunit
MIRTLLIANRGEIACRIIRTARRMGIATVGVYSDADRDALHVKMADRAVRIGGAPPKESYLNGAAIIAAAKETGADAVHPGYGFLSENAGFAAACAGAGLVFVGPPADAIHAMGDKARARQLMVKAGVPVVPGYDGKDQGEAAFAKAAEKIGYPLLVKAAAGGGGRGMRRVDDAKRLKPALDSARREAENAFGDGALLLEKLVTDARHIEFQIFADSFGNCIHLGERDCSAQRRHQKVIEEAPSPFVDEKLRERMGADAVQAALSVRYRGAGTVEFIVGQDGSYYFLEMNTRLQVEHPVTEEVTGFDLVEWQLRVADGEALPVRQDAVKLTGHAIEARLYAEDPFDGFRPQSGKVLYWRPDAALPGVRIDNGVAESSEITPYYDPMIAKVIVHGKDRAEAIERLIGALAAHPLFGIRTNRTFLSRLTESAEFRSGQMTTGLIDHWVENFDAVLDRPVAGDDDFALAGAALALSARGDWFRSTGTAMCPVTLENGDERRQVVSLIPRGELASVLVGGAEAASGAFCLDGSRLMWKRDEESNLATVLVDGRFVHVDRNGVSFVFAEPDPLAVKPRPADPARIIAPVSGLVRQVAVKAGDRVETGQLIAVVEAMKMENTLHARAGGVVASIAISAGEQARAGDLIVELKVDQ